jgi:hypothetical protein
MNAIRNPALLHVVISLSMPQPLSVCPILGNESQPWERVCECALRGHDFSPMCDGFWPI